jgi:hypothetical protein
LSQDNQSRNWLSVLLVATITSSGLVACQGAKTARESTPVQGATTQSNPTPAEQTAAKPPQATATAGWLVVGRDGKPVPTATLSAQDGGVVLNYQREKPASLAHYQAPIASFKAFDLRVKSEQAIPLAIFIQDADGAQFIATRQVPAQKWQTIELKPTDFKPIADSPVKKPKLDPIRTTKGYVLFDLGTYTGKSGNNQLQIVFDNVKKDA